MIISCHVRNSHKTNDRAIYDCCEGSNLVTLPTDHCGNCCRYIETDTSESEWKIHLLRTRFLHVAKGYTPYHHGI
jgi:hypothetical protein